MFQSSQALFDDSERRKFIHSGYIKSQTMLLPPIDILAQ